MMKPQYSMFYHTNVHTNLLQDTNGMLQQTELYHFTDHTGNEGDNTWFTLEPEHHLVSAIWTNYTYIGLEWDIQRRLVEFDVHITADDRKTHAKFNLVDLSQLKVLENLDLNVTGKHNEPNEECNRLPFTVTQCGKKVTKLVVNATIKARKEFTMPARYLTRKGGYEFVLPKAQFTNNKSIVIEKQCSFAIKVRFNVFAVTFLNIFWIMCILDYFLTLFYSLCKRLILYMQAGPTKSQ